MELLVVLIALFLLVWYFVYVKTSKDDLQKANVVIEQEVPPMVTEAQKVETYAINNGDLDAPLELAQRGEALKEAEDKLKVVAQPTPVVEAKPKRTRKPAAIKATVKKPRAKKTTTK